MENYKSFSISERNLKYQNGKRTLAKILEEL